MANKLHRVLYGEANYETLVADNGYYVDKTQFIPLLEKFRSPVFLRPRRFGKSLLCTTLQYYYDVAYKDRFEELFSHTWIGRHPTGEQGNYHVLHLDFSGVEPFGSVDQIRERFNLHVNVHLKDFVFRNRASFPEPVEIELKGDASSNLQILTRHAQALGLPPFYILIDEYDNFANQLIVERKDAIYREITSEQGFLKTFFKILKICRKANSVGRIFITGVLPITIDDLASGFNIADFITLDDDFEALVGFTQEEVDHLLDRIYEDYDLNPESREQVTQVIKSNYNGYHIANTRGEGLYNSTILIYFLEKLTRFKKIPEFLTDINLKTDIAWVRRLTASNPERTRQLLDTLTIDNRLSYGRMQLRDKFDMSQFFETSFYPISFFYLGMLTREDDYFMRIPNLNMKAIFSEYFSEFHGVNVGTLYSDLMSKFAKSPDLEELFKGYWELFIAQLPEAVFASVNENFYRTTFYFLSYQFLSNLYVWRMENSHPSGRSDLEMEGKFHTAFAKDHYLMEFKYLSNANAEKQKLDITTFEARKEDLDQLSGYAKDLEKQYPEKQLKTYLIYCFGNRGFRMFRVQ